MREPSIIRLSSMLAMISDVLSPLRRSSPLVLKLAKVKVLLSHSAITCLSFCSMSRSFTALIQMSCSNMYRKWLILKPKARWMLQKKANDNLDFFFVFQKWCFHDIPKLEVICFNLKGVTCNLRDPLPVACHHGFISHQLQQGAALTEFIDGFLQVHKRLPFFKASWQLATSAIRLITSVG